MERIPTSAAEIDATWLGDALAERHPRARVARVELLESHETTNSHARLRVDYEEAAGAPATMFCKLLPGKSRGLEREAIARTWMGVREAMFYERLAPGLELRAPTVYAVRHDEASGEFVVLMEDLAATGCTVSDGRRCVTPDAAAVALEDLAGLHLRFLDPARRQAEAPWVPPPDPPSDYGTTRLQYALDHHRDRLSPAFAELAELYVAKTPAVHDLWHPRPWTVIHGDPHIGNLFDDAGRTGFLDWGLITLSTPLRDACYFLTMALSVEDRRRHERDLLRHYLDVHAAGGGTAWSFDQAWETYRVQASYLVPACCQIVTFPENVGAKRRVFAEAFLERSVAALDDLEVRAALRELGGL